MDDFIERVMTIFFSLLALFIAVSMVGGVIGFIGGLFG